MAIPIPHRTTLLTFCLVFALASPALPAAPKPAPTKAGIRYGSHPHQLLDVYLPPQGKAPFPVVIWFRGLWKPSKHAPVEHFLPAGCAAVAVEVRTMFVCHCWLAQQCFFMASCERLGYEIRCQRIGCFPRPAGSAGQANSGTRRPLENPDRVPVPTLI